MEMQSTIEKIKKCLSLANNNSSENEVKVAMKMAHAMALKANICIDDLDFNPDIAKKIEVTKDTIKQSTKGVQMWRYRLCKVIADNFRSSIYKEQTLYGSNIKVIGAKKDVEIIKVVFEFAENAYQELSKKYLNKVKKERNVDRSLSVRLKNDYFEGYLNGLKEAFEENVQELGLIVLKPEAVDEFMGTCKKQNIKGSVRAGNQDALWQGHADGQFIGQAKRGEYIN